MRNGCAPPHPRGIEMAVDSLVIKIKDTLMSLEVNADAHREEKGP